MTRLFQFALAGLLHLIVALPIQCSADDAPSKASTPITIARLEPPREIVMAVAFLNDGRSLAVGSGNLTCGMIRVWEAPDWKLVTTIRAHDKFVYSLAVDPQGEVSSRRASMRQSRSGTQRRGCRFAI